MLRRRFIALGGAALAAPALLRGARAETYPSRFVRLVVPFPPGGTVDAGARIIAARLSEMWGQQMVVENRAGIGGNIAAQAVLSSEPDGYTVYITSIGHAIAQFVTPSTAFDPVADFAPVSLLAVYPNIMAIPNSSPSRTLPEFIARAKQNPGQVTYCSSGVGTSLHLAGELFKRMAGVDLTHIPYRGAGPALNDTVAGQVQIIFDNLPSALPFIKDGRLIPIVVAAPTRLAVLPNVPTFKEVGLEPVNRMAYYGIYGPKGLSKDVVDKVYAAVKATVALPDVKKRIEETGSIIVANTPDEFAAQIKAEFAVYKKVVETAKLVLE